MSRRGAIVAVAVALVAAPAHAEPAAPPQSALWVAIPSLDGGRGLELGGERGLTPRHAWALAVSARQTAASDYTAVRLAVAGVYRWYWRGDGRWNRLAGLARSGWFVGGRVDLGTAHLTMGERAIGTTVVVGARAELGYRLTPWRGLMVTGLVSLGGHVERDTAGRLPLEGHRALGLGLDVGWMF